MMRRLTASLNVIPKFNFVTRDFHAKLNPVTPGILKVNTSVNTTVSPASTSENLATCISEVKFASKSVSPLVVDDLTASLSVALTEEDGAIALSVNATAVDYPEDVELKIAVPHHYC